MAELIPQVVGDILVIDFSSNSILDASRATAVGAELRSMLDQTEQTKVLLDFRRVTLITSGMIGELLKVKKKCHEERVDLAMCNFSSDLMDLFRKLKLQKTFEIFGNRDKAFRAFSKR